MANQDLLKQAIAEAKAIREAAISNAKDVMEESLTPHLKDMLAAKLQEMEAEEMAETVEEEVVEEESVEEGSYDKDEMEEAKHDDDMDEAKHDKDMDEAKHEDEMDEAEVAETEEVVAEEDEDEEPAEDDAEKSEDEAEEDVDVKDMEVDDLKALIKDMIAQELEGHEDHMHDGEEIEDEEGGMEDMVAADDEEINLEELLKELESLGEEEVAEEEVAEAKHDDEDAMEEGKHEDEDAMEEEVSEEVEESTDLNEALDTIEILRKELSEVNLLNSKLLYVNKIFKANNLSENQKVNIIATFDKAETVKEVKLVYETVAENITSVKSEKTNLKEHKSFASKATGNSTKGEVISEVSEQVRRMQRLAGIIK